MSEPRVLQRGARAVTGGKLPSSKSPSSKSPSSKARSLSALLALGLCWAAPRAAEACYCVAPELEGSIDKADVIFEGVTAAAPEEIEQDIGLGVYGDVQTRRYDFEVLRYFKNASDDTLPGELALHTPVQAPACGRTFDASQVYLIYARVRDDGLLVDFRCSRTRSFDAADEDLARLGEGTAPDESAALALAGGELEEPNEALELEPGTRAAQQIGGGCSQAGAPGGGPSALGLLALVLPALRRVRARRERNVTP
jgi:hypothetical protein